MRHTILLSIFALALTSCAKDIKCEIPTWHRGCAVAVSLTFDDNCPNQFNTAQPIMESYGFYGTFFVIFDGNENYNDLRNAYESGHEIACHTMTHTDLATLTDEQMDFQFSACAEKIKKEIGARMLTLAYPYCSRPESSIPLKYFVAARTCSGKIDKPTPDDYMGISSFGVGSESSYYNAAPIINLLEDAVDSTGWVTLLIHEIDNGPGYSPFSSDDLERVLDHLFENQDRFWVAPFADVARYTKERDVAQVTASISGDEIHIVLTAEGLDPAIYNVPITLEVELPDGWNTVDAQQDNLALDACIDNGKIIFEAIPNRGEIIVQK